MPHTAAQQEAVANVKRKDFPSLLRQLQGGSAREVVDLKDYEGSGKPLLSGILCLNPTHCEEFDECLALINRLTDGRAFTEKNGGWIPLHYASYHCHDPKVLSAVLSCTPPGSLNEPDLNSPPRTPLHWLQNSSPFSHKAAMEAIFEEALADHAAFAAKYSPCRPRTISEYASLIASDPLDLLRSDASGCSLLDRARLHDEEPAVVAFLEEKMVQALECRDAFPGVDDETFKRNFQVWLDV